MYTAPATSTATYSYFGLYAMAMLAGMVHGVVVQMRPNTSRPARSGWIFAGSEVNSKRTQIDGLVWSLYSTSASASAVRSLMHQCTGLRPLYT